MYVPAALSRAMIQTSFPFLVLQVIGTRGSVPVVKSGCTSRLLPRIQTSCHHRIVMQRIVGQVRVRVANLAGQQLLRQLLQQMMKFRTANFFRGLVVKGSSAPMV